MDTLPIRLDREAQPPCLHLAGDWTLARHATLAAAVATMSLPPDGEIAVDMYAVGALDTAGAALIARLLGAQRLTAWLATQPALPATQRALLQTLGDALQTWGTPPAPVHENPLTAFFVHIGQAMETVGRQQWVLLGFIGMTLERLAVGLFHPRKWRLTPLAAQIAACALKEPRLTLLGEPPRRRRLTFLSGRQARDGG